MKVRNEEKWRGFFGDVGIGERREAMWDVVVERRMPVAARLNLLAHQRMAVNPKVILAPSTCLLVLFVLTVYFLHFTSAFELYSIYH